MYFYHVQVTGTAGEREENVNFGAKLELPRVLLISACFHCLSSLLLVPHDSLRAN